MALVAYNVLSTVKGALCSVHGETKVEKLSGFYLADEIQMCHRGMMKAIPKDEWVVFQAATTTEFAEVMKVCWHARYRWRNTRATRAGQRNQS